MMRMQMMWVGAVLLLALAGLGCAGSSKYMQKAPEAGPIQATADQATVVFLRPSGFGFAVNISILDQRGNWVGDAVAKSHFAVQLPPGEYMFIGWAENTAALKATLAPGRIYYVEVIAETGLGSARVTLEAVSPRRPNWAKLSQWMVETKRLVPNAKGYQYYAGRRQDAAERVASAQENWVSYAADEQEERTLRPEDGIGSTGAPAPEAVAAAPAPAPPPPPAADPAAVHPAEGTAGSTGGCVNDMQCKGDRICVNRECVAPNPPSNDAVPD